MASSSASSSSSSSASSSPSPPPPSSKPQLKRKRATPPDPESTDSDSEAGNDDAEVNENEDEDEEPVLSHAAKRKQKKQLKIDPSSPSFSSPSKSTTIPVTTPAKKQKTTSKSADKDKDKDKPSGPPKRQNSVWVGNLSFKTTEEALKRFFEGAGEVTRVHMPVKAVGPQKGKFGMKENRGFAYVDFTTEEAKKNAILMSEGHLDGRKLLIKDGDDFTGRPAAPATTAEGDTSKSSISTAGHSKVAQKILSVQTQPPAPTLFFGNLGFETTQESLRGLLEAHRKVKPEVETGTDGDAENVKVEGGEKKDAWIRKIRMGTFEDSGLCKGWAFVDFTSTEHATAALTNPRNHHMDGRKLKVEYASADAVRRGGGPGTRPERSKPRRDDSRGGFQHREQQQQQQRRGPRNSGAAADAGEDETMEDGTGGGSGGGGEDSPRKRKEGGERVRLDRKGKPRTKPGAALAAAQREQAAIVPSLGTKITFD